MTTANPFDDGTKEDATWERQEAVDRLAAGEWPSPDALVKQLASLGDDDRLARIHDLISWLGGQNDLQRQRYRNAIVTAEYIGRQDWRSMLAEAKREHAAKRRASSREADCPYVVRNGCLYLPTYDGGEALLARFTAEVIAEVTRDDGAEVTKNIRLLVKLPTGRAAEVDVPADRLHRAREWATQAVGAAAVITPMSRDEAHVATAAQYLGNYMWDSETVYAHTGWRVDLNSGHRFLTASGALGAAGLDTGVTVDLGNDRLNHYALPDPTTAEPGDLADAVRASLDLLKVAPAKVTAPMLGAAYRAPLPLLPESSVFVVGPSGSLKTALSAVVCQHFGRRLDAKGLPAEWKSTANSLEATAYQLAGVLLVIDDYAPQAADDPRRLAAAADRVFRGAANASGRGRMRPDGTLRPPKPPRSQVLSTGEDVPPGESLRARLTIASVDAGAVDVVLLSDAQRKAASGLYELAMAGYVRWLAERQDADPGYVDNLRKQITTRRAELTAAGSHLRVPESIAGLLTGWRHWLEYAVAITAITGDDAQKVMAEVSEATKELAAEQAVYTSQMKVARVYLTSLAVALIGGGAHLADQDTGNEPPATPKAWGWEQYVSGGAECWRPRGTCFGWVSRAGDVYLDPGAAYEVARNHAGKAAVPLATTKGTISKRLAEGGHLASVDKDQNTVVREIVGRRRRVLHVHANLITGSED